MSHPPLKTYHCLCSTLLLATPYPLPLLPRRAPPSLDRAYILPVPALSHPTLNDPKNPDAEASAGDGNGDGDSREDRVENALPSLLMQNLRPARKIVIVRREDGFEKRRVYRCGRCGVCVGYEVLGDSGVGGKEKERVLYLLEGGLLETGEMGEGVAGG